jgi:hypothetical protein
MKRSVAVLAVATALVYAPAAAGWTWPVEGPVLRPFVFGDDPYAAGQHRGIDIGATPGTTVRSAAAGAVSFAGTVPAGNRAVTVRTAGGLSVTYLELGVIHITRGDEIGEGQPIGTIGEAAHVHLGVRSTADPQGYLDPLQFLPVRAVSGNRPEPLDEVGAEVARPQPVSVKPDAGEASSPGETSKPEVDAGSKPASPVLAQAPKGDQPAAPAPGEPSARIEPAPRQVAPTPASAPTLTPTPTPEAVAVQAPSTTVAAEAPSVEAPAEQVQLGLAPRVTVERKPPVRWSAEPADGLVQTPRGVAAGVRGAPTRARSFAPAGGRVAASGLRPAVERSRSASPAEVSRAQAREVERGREPLVSRRSAGAQDSADPILFLGGLIGLAALGVVGVIVRRRRRRRSPESLSPRFVSPLPGCPRGRVRPARLIHACARAGELGLLASGTRPRPLRELHRPLPRPRRRVAAGVRV